MTKEKLRVIPLGGLGEIGKNMLALESGPDLLVIDAGIMFPEEEMPGVDLVLPDISYLRERKGKLRAFVITHGHEDHTGALPYVLSHLPAPIYSTRLVHGLISVKLKEHKLLSQAKLHVVKAGDEVTLGRFRVLFFHVSHSIPDAVGLAIRTPQGIVVHSGDFKVDHTPVDGRPTDFARLAQLGGEGVLLLLSDSTYVETSAYTPSERLVGETLDRIMAEAPGRVIVATFASLISRIQQVAEAAVRHQRRLMIVGRSMISNVQMALKLGGYLQIPEGLLASWEELRKLPPRQVAIVMTGTQGEPTSALVRVANRDHPQLHIIPGDTVVISATAIPGNEGLINRTIDNLFKQGAQVLYDKIAPVHVHGHGSQEDLKMMINLVRPRFFVPIHGEYRHLALHAKLAQSLNIPSDRVFVLEDGDILELDAEGGRVVGRVPAGHVYVDGLGVGDIGSVVLRDRKLLSQDGIVVTIVAIDKRTGKLVGRPDIVSRGFVSPSEAEALTEKGRELVTKALGHGGEHLAEPGFIQAKVKDVLSKFFYEETKRRPMILPIAVKV